MNNVIARDVRNLIPLMDDAPSPEELARRIHIDQYLEKTEDVYTLNLISEENAISNLSKIFELEDPKLKGIALACLGGVHTFNGNYKKAFAAFDMALDQPYENDVRAYVLLEISNLMRKLGYLREAVSILNASLNLTKMKKLRWRIKTYIGLTYKYKNPEHALSLLEKSAEHYTKSGESSRLSTVIRHMGLACVRTGDFKKAKEYFDEVMSIAVEKGLTEHQNEVANDLGWLLINQKQYDKARELFDKHIRKNLSPYLMSLALQNIGYLEFERENYAEAIKFHSQSLQLTTRYEMREMAFEDYYKLGLSYEKLGQAGTAAHFFTTGYKELMAEIKLGLPVLGYRQKLLDSFVDFLTRNQKIPYVDLEEEIFGFAMDKSLKEIRNIFHKSLLTLHLERTKNAPQMCTHLDIDTRTYFLHQKRLGLSRGKPRKGLFLDNPQFTQYVESLTPLTWKEANKKFEQDLLDYMMAKYQSNKTEIAKALDVSYAQVVLKTK